MFQELPRPWRLEWSEEGNVPGDEVREGVGMGGWVAARSPGILLAFILHEMGTSGGSKQSTACLDLRLTVLTLTLLLRTD